MAVDALKMLRALDSDADGAMTWISTLDGALSKVKLRRKVRMSCRLVVTFSYAWTLGPQSAGHLS